MLGNNIWVHHLTNLSTVNPVSSPPGMRKSNTALLYTHQLIRTPKLDRRHACRESIGDTTTKRCCCCCCNCSKLHEGRPFPCDRPTFTSFVYVYTHRCYYSRPTHRIYVTFTAVAAAKYSTHPTESIKPIPSTSSGGWSSFHVHIYTFTLYTREYISCVYDFLIFLTLQTDARRVTTELYHTRTSYIILLHINYLFCRR